MNGPHRARVLVLDADMIASLSVARSLHRHGIHVDVASHAKQPLTAHSVCAQRTLQYPNPLADEDAFVDWVRASISTSEYQLIIPTTERSLGALHRQRDRIDAGAVAMPPAEALANALDKGRTMRLAESLGIRVPLGREVYSEAEALSFAEESGYPIVIKPSSSIGTSDTNRVHLSVSYANNEEELRCGLVDALRFGNVLVQERFPGIGVGIELIADHGTIRYAFQHQRLHEVPLTGGGSSLRKSVPLDPILLEVAAKLMQATRWHGVAMVELKQNLETGTHCLMEINGRFWGSLPLAIASGADFPVMLYELLVDGQVQPRPAARTGVYCRNLARDIEWLELVLRRAAPRGLVTLPPWTRIFRDSILMFSPRHHFDVQQWRDPVPGLVDLGQIASRYSRRLGGQIVQKHRLRHQRAAWRGNRMKRRLRASRNLLFLCYGNINRSALAEKMAVERLRGSFSIMSAGFHPRSGRPVDPTMRDIAADHGLDLSTSRSKRLDRQMLEWADLIYAMDLSHLDKIRALYPQSIDKAFLLGPAASDAVPGVEIDDPYGKSRAVYDRCFNQIARCIDALADLSDRR